MSLCFALNSSAQSNYKHMMQDMSVNFYEVCAAADAYFETHDKGKGSGWKGYQRWRSENESKYYPSGDRSQSDPLFAAHAYQDFIKRNGKPSSAGRSFDNGWRELGPWNVDNITSHYSPGIGRVEALWVNPNDDQHIYLGSRSGGFWKTTNGGNQWRNTTDTLIAAGVNTIGVSPTNPDSILINVRNGGNSATHGIYRSTDGGDSWTLTNFNPANLNWGGLGTVDQVYKIVYHPLIPNLVFIGTSRGLFRSDDGLETWTQPLTVGSIIDIEFHPGDLQSVYLYDDRNNGPYEDNVLRSTDQGLSFTPSQQIIGNNGVRGHIAVSPGCDSCVYFASANGVWLSGDSGSTFSLLSVPTQNCRGFAVSDLDPDYMVYGYVDMEASANGGQSFFMITDWSIDGTSLPSDYVHADLRTAECVNGVFYAGTDGFLCKSTDNGNSWTQLNNGTGIREFYAAGLSQSDWRVQMAGSQDNGTSILDGNGWIEWNGGDGMEALVQPLRPDWMIGSWQYGTRNITRDAGQSRQGSENPEGGSGEADWIAPLLLNPNQQMEVYHFGSSMYRSTTFGDGNWELVGTPAIGRAQVADIAQNNSDIIAVSRQSNLRISTDGGETFFTPSGALPNYSITDIAFDPNDDSTLVVTYNRYQSDSKKIYVSHDLGSSWTNITANLGDMPIRTVVIDHTPEANIYVGAEIGVFTKPMNGTNWTLYNPNLPNATVRDLEIQYGTNILRASTWGRGLWEYKLVDRKDYPAITITSVSEFPMRPAPMPLVDQYVTAQISYAQTLSSVYVLWSDSQPTFDHAIPMSNTQDSTWVSDDFIPHLPIGTDMYFKVVAVGAANDTTETYRFHYVSMQEPPADTNLGVIQSDFELPIRVYPNPSSGVFTIDMGEWNNSVAVEVHNLEGKRVFTQQTSGPRIELDLELDAGIYFLHLSATDAGSVREQPQATIKLIIE